MHTGLIAGNRIVTARRPIIWSATHVSPFKVRMASAANGPASPIQLYDLAPEPGICPFVQRAKITLKEKQLPFTTTYIDGANKDPKFLDLFRSITSNPSHRGTVPVIIDGDVKVAESHIVSEYLDVQYPTSGTKLLPSDPYKLALVRQFVENFSTLVLPVIFKILTVESLQENDETISAQVNGWKVIDTFLRTYGDKSGNFLLGKDFSYAEAATLPFLYRSFLLLSEFRNVSATQLIEDNNLTHLQRWQEDGFGRPSLKETLPPDSVIIDSIKPRLKVALKDLK